MPNEQEGSLLGSPAPTTSSCILGKGRKPRIRAVFGVILLDSKSMKPFIQWEESDLWLGSFTFPDCGEVRDFLFIAFSGNSFIFLSIYKYHKKFY